MLPLSRENTVLEADQLVTQDVRDSICCTSVMLNVISNMFQIQSFIRLQINT